MCFPLLNPSSLLFMAEILHQLIGSLSHCLVYRVSYIPGGAGFQPSSLSPRHGSVHDSSAWLGTFLPRPRVGDVETRQPGEGCQEGTLRGLLVSSPKGSGFFWWVNKGATTKIRPDWRIQVYMLENTYHMNKNKYSTCEHRQRKTKHILLNN